jgi:hypothetical protein
MGYRRFTDRDGNTWEVRDRSQSEWELQPVSGNPKPSVRVQAPGYESDPFELSNEEMQQLLDSGPSGSRGARKSPFKD